MTHESSVFPIDQMFKQPSDWIGASLPKFIESTQAISESDCDTYQFDLEQVRLRITEERWHDLTGIASSDTHCTIIIPVHNEENSLPSVLGALLQSEIPSSADIQFVFVANACNDESAAIIKHRLQWIGEMRPITLPPSTHDPDRTDTALELKHRNIRFLIVHTPTAGKANALTIGNEIALQANHLIAINIDANNWVEPDTIALIFRKAKERIIENTLKDVALVDGNPKSVVNTHMQNFVEKFHDWIRECFKQKFISNTNKTMLSGWLFAWDTYWLQEIGGFPPNATEDKAIAITAFAQNKQVEHTDAPIWGYSAATFNDKNKQEIRFILGALQILNQYRDNPKISTIMNQGHPLHTSMYDRFKYYLNEKMSGRKISLFPYFILRWVRFEYNLRMAKMMLRHDPNQQTWIPITSTK